MMSESRLPLKILLALEMELGYIDGDKLEERVAATLEFTNKELKSFDMKKREEGPTRFADQLVVWMRRGNLRLPLLIVSPRLENGKYIAQNVIIGQTDAHGQPYFGLPGKKGLIGSKTDAK